MEDKKKSLSPFALVGAFLFIGMGVGFLQNNLTPWMFIGIGTGLVAAFIVQYLTNQKNKDHEN